MVIKVYVTAISANNVLKRNQQAVVDSLSVRNIAHEVVDISAPENEEAKVLMRERATPKSGQNFPMPPQIFDDGDYIGDYDAFAEALEGNCVEVFFKQEAPKRVDQPPVEDIREGSEKSDKEALETEKNGEQAVGEEIDEDARNDDGGEKKEGESAETKSDETDNIESETDEKEVANTEIREVQEGENLAEGQTDDTAGGRDDEGDAAEQKLEETELVDNETTANEEENDEGTEGESADTNSADKEQDSVGDSIVKETEGKEISEKNIDESESVVKDGADEKDGTETVAVEAAEGDANDVVNEEYSTERDVKLSGKDAEESTPPDDDVDEQINNVPEGSVEKTDDTSKIKER